MTFKVGNSDFLGTSDSCLFLFFSGGCDFRFQYWSYIQYLSVVLTVVMSLDQQRAALHFLFISFILFIIVFIIYYK